MNQGCKQINDGVEGVCVLVAYLYNVHVDMQTVAPFISLERFGLPHCRTHPLIFILES